LYTTGLERLVALAAARAVLEPEYRLAVVAGVLAQEPELAVALV
jgi:hypothetical protein